MDIFGIGPLEFFLILLVALIFLGPNDMAKAGRSLGRFLRRLVMSEEWRIITQSAREFRHFPERLMREAGVEDIKNELPDLRRDADLDGLNRDLTEWQRDVSGWTKQVDKQASQETTPKDQPTIAPPEKSGNAKPSAPAPKPAQSAKPKAPWDEPDIVPVEDESS
jgi:hypothetical protein